MSHDVMCTACGVVYGWPHNRSCPRTLGYANIEGMNEIASLRREVASQLETIDALTKQAQDASDKHAAVQLKAGVHAVHAMLRHVTGKVALGHDERPWVDAVKAWLFENGASVYEEQTELPDARALLVESGR